MTLELDDFATFGKWLAQIKIPTAAFLEGGYSNELPILIDAFLSAWDSATNGRQTSVPASADQHPVP
jgi:acetoin utilization deacetylase AcuC-like enzyme